jgi:hypothetical protein
VGHADKYIANIFSGIRAVLWDDAGLATELGNLGTSSGGLASSSAYAINDAGIAVGFASEYDGSGNLLGQRAVMWGLDGMAINLNTLIDPSSGWVNLYTARAISNDNWVTGLGLFDPDGAAGPLPAYDRPFLVQVPEPGSMTLWAAGAMTLLARRRRKLTSQNRRSIGRNEGCAEL